MLKGVTSYMHTSTWELLHWVMCDVFYFHYSRWTMHANGWNNYAINNISWVVMDMQWYVVCMVSLLQLSTRKLCWEREHNRKKSLGYGRKSRNTGTSCWHCSYMMPWQDESPGGLLAVKGMPDIGRESSGRKEASWEGVPIEQWCV